MTGLFISIDEYVPDPISMEVDCAIAKLKRMDMQEEYDITPSVSNIEGWPKIPLQERRKSRQPRQ